MKLNEYGNNIYVQLNYDISANTSIVIVIADEAGAKTNYTGVLGTSTLSTPLGDYAANQYCYYTVQENDFTKVGKYSVKAEVTLPGPKRLVSDRGYFIIEE